MIYVKEEDYGLNIRDLNGCTICPSKNIRNWVARILLSYSGEVTIDWRSGGYDSLLFEECENFFKKHFSNYYICISSNYDKGIFIPALSINFD